MQRGKEKTILSGIFLFKLFLFLAGLLHRIANILKCWQSSFITKILKYLKEDPVDNPSNFLCEFSLTQFLGNFFHACFKDVKFRQKQTRFKAGISPKFLLLNLKFGWQLCIDRGWRRFLFEAAVIIALLIEKST